MPSMSRLTSQIQHQGLARSIAKARLLLRQVRSIGKRDYNPLFKLGDEMIQFQGLHGLLALAVSEMVPVNVAVLLSEDVKRQVRPHQTHHSKTMR